MLSARPPLTPGKTQYPLYRRLGGPQGRSGQVRKISLPPGFDPLTVQPIVSHYTDYTILAHKFSALGKIQYTDTYAQLPAFPSVMNTSSFPLIHTAI